MLYFSHNNIVLIYWENHELTIYTNTGNILVCVAIKILTHIYQQICCANQSVLDYSKTEKKHTTVLKFNYFDKLSISLFLSFIYLALMLLQLRSLVIHYIQIYYYKETYTYLSSPQIIFSLSYLASLNLAIVESLRPVFVCGGDIKRYFIKYVFHN